MSGATNTFKLRVLSVGNVISSLKYLYFICDAGIFEFAISVVLVDSLVSYCSLGI